MSGTVPGKGRTLCFVMNADMALPIIQKFEDLSLLANVDDFRYRLTEFRGFWHSSSDNTAFNPDGTSGGLRAKFAAASASS